MIPRGTLSISNRDLFSGIFYCFANCFQFKKSEISKKQDKTLTCLSVRTGFDLALSALNLPAGSEILVTDINIPDMFKIITAHNLIPIPLPLNKQTLSISTSYLESSITTATKAILITHLFGAIMDTHEINTIAKKHNLFIFEDCAQAYNGKAFKGNITSDIVMFSFGLIKTNTAIRGAVIHIKDPDLYADISCKHEQYKKQLTSSFLIKLLKAILIKILTTRIVYSGFYNIIKIQGRDFEAVLTSLSKGFPGEDILQQIRLRPCLPNIKLLQKKLDNFNQESIAKRKLLANDILQHIPKRYRVGALNIEHTYWVQPIETNAPNRLINYMRSNGFDASQKSSSLMKYTKVGSVPDPEDLTLENIVYLPAHPSMSKKDRNKLSHLLTKFHFTEVNLDEPR